MKLSPEQLAAVRSVPADVIPNRLRIAFAVAGVKQAEACAAIGLIPSQMSDLVNGKYRTVSVDTARSLADFFGCSIEDLFPAREGVA